MLDDVCLNEAAIRSALELDLFEMADRDALGIDDFSSQEFQKLDASHLPPGIRRMMFSDSHCSQAKACVSSARMSTCRSFSILIT